MVYLKSAIAGIVMVGATALVLYVTLTLLLIVPVLRRGEGFDLPRWPYVPDPRLSGYP